jgi:hypothetical protein
MKTELLKEYINATLKEDWYWNNEKNDEKPVKKSKGFFDKLKNLFSGKGKYEDIAEDWLSEKTMYYDVEVTDNFKKEVLNFVEKKYRLAVQRAKGNDEKAVVLIKKALDNKYEKSLKVMANSLSKLEDEEDI